MVATGVSGVRGLKGLEVCGSSSLPTALCLNRNLIFTLTLQQNKPICIANLGKQRQQLGNYAITEHSTLQS